LDDSSRLSVNMVGASAYGALDTGRLIACSANA
jgi:hypothetical protein